MLLKYLSRPPYHVGYCHQVRQESHSHSKVSVHSEGILLSPSVFASAVNQPFWFSFTVLSPVCIAPSAFQHQVRILLLGSWHWCLEGLLCLTLEWDINLFTPEDESGRSSLTLLSLTMLICSRLGPSNLLSLLTMPSVLWIYSTLVLVLFLALPSVFSLESFYCAAILRLVLVHLLLLGRQ